MDKVVARLDRIFSKASLAVDSTIRLSSRAALNLGNAEVNAQWLGPANGDLYLLLELPTNSAVTSKGQRP